MLECVRSDTDALFLPPFLPLRASLMSFPYNCKAKLFNALITLILPFIMLLLKDLADYPLYRKCLQGVGIYESSVVLFICVYFFLLA